MTIEVNVLEQLARETLVLNAIDRSPYMPGYQWDVVPAAMVADLIQRGRIDYTSRDRVFVLTDTGERELAHYRNKTVVRDGIGRWPSGNEPSPGDRAMMTWLLMNGGIIDNYGTYPEVRADVMHVLACGVDYDESSPVRDDTWTTWGGTFAEGDRQVGVGAGITCLCGEVKSLHVVAQVESMVDLIKAMVAP